MDVIYGVLYIAGLAVPLVLSVASFFLVHRLARRLRGFDAAATSVPRMLGLHAAVVALALILDGLKPLGFLPLVALVLVPAHLLRRLRRTPGQRTVEASVAPAREVSRTTAHRMAWFMAVSGVLLPWMVGLGVKLVLQSQGRPTLPISGFVEPSSIAVLLLLTMMMWASPFLALAVLVAIRYSAGGSRKYSFRHSPLPAWWTYSAGVASSLAVFARLFQDFDTLLLLVPIGFFLLPPMVLAFLAACILVNRGSPGSDPHKEKTMMSSPVCEDGDARKLRVGSNGGRTE